jgi:hypothetical protein
MPFTRISCCFALLLLAGCAADSRAPEQTTPVPSITAESASHSVGSNSVPAPATPVVDTVKLTMNAEVVLASIKALGPDSFVAVHFDDRLLDSIGTGHQPWLAVADRVAPGTDASTAESLQDAITIALPNAPGPVLRFLAASSSRAFNFASICSGPPDYSEGPDTEQSLRERAAGRARLVAALRTVDDTPLKRMRDACIVQAEERPPCAPPARGGCSVGWPRILGRDASVDSIWRAIDAGGAAAGLQRMVPDDTLPTPYRERLAAGSDPWLAVAAAVLTAAESTETMRNGRPSHWAQFAIADAITDAIVVKPESVLNGMARYSTFGVDLCDHDLDTAAKKARRDRMVTALASVTDPELAALRDACAMRVLVPMR